MEIISKEIWKYVKDHSDPEPDLLKVINRETHVNYLFPRMLSGHFQGRLLSMFSKMIKPSCILEIGTYTGYSTVCLAEGLIPGGEIHTIEINIELEETINNNFKKAGLSEFVSLHLGNATDIIPQLTQTWDLAFIDADKVNYILYFELILKQLKPGGFIFADNVLWDGKVVSNFEKDKEADSLMKFNDYISCNTQIENILLPVRDGIMLIRKKI